MKQNRLKSVSVDLVVGSKAVAVQLGSGAGVGLISEGLAERLHLDVYETDLVLEGTNEKGFDIVGECEIIGEIAGISVKLGAVVIRTKKDIFLMSLDDQAKNRIDTMPIQLIARVQDKEVCLTPNHHGYTFNIGRIKDNEVFSRVIDKEKK